ncbi:MAG TPA: NlpC/P60 family protein [Gaiellaceae bacterium]|jgi:cell wall-associated NlpC family hydrolase
MRSTRRKAPALVIAFVALFAATAISASADTVASKRAEAQSVLNQIQQLDSSLERAIEAYDLANVKLAHIKHDLSQNTTSLHVAKRSLKNANRELSSRLVDLYTSQNQDSTLVVLLGSSSLDDMLNNMDAVDRVSQQDSIVLKQVIDLRREVQQRERELKKAHSEQTQVVAQRAAAKSSIESQLGQRRALLSSIKTEIVKLQQEEAARAAELKREAEARLQQQSTSSNAISQTVSISAPPAGAPPPSQYGGVVGYAMSFVGTPYVWGGASPSGFDCSGFVMYVYAHFGVSLPHSSYAQYGYGSPVSMSQLQPGDLVFFDGLGHVGIYVGGGSFIHAPHTGDVVKVSSLTGWYASTFVGGRRL